jgi:hypothetical protein
MLESALQVKILKMLSSCGLLARSLEYKGRTGCPDLVILDPPTVWLEVKTKTGKLRPAQVREIKRIKEHGGIVRVVRSIDDAKEVLSEYYPKQSSRLLPGA